jgi:hypothetical protein
MKKLITLTCAFVLALSLNSCGGSDDSPSGPSSSDKIVGTWKFAGDMYMGNFEPYVGESCDDELFKFVGNNTAQFIEKYCGDATDVTNFTWAKTTDPTYNYSYTDPETGDVASVVIVFSTDYSKFTTYETEDDMLNEDAGEVYQKQ